MLDAATDGMVSLSGTVAERARDDDRWEPGHAVSVAWLPEHSLVLR